MYYAKALFPEETRESASNHGTKRKEDCCMNKSMVLGLSFALISLVACVRGPEEDILPEANITLTALTENPAGTRTMVAENDETTAKVYWEPGDTFWAFTGGQKGDFYTQIPEPCETAPFRGFFEYGFWEPGMDLWALYPWSWETAFEDGVFTTIMPFRQEARPGTFGREANLAIAHTTSNTIQFHNVGGGVRFSVQEEGIKEVILQGLDGEYLAGKIQVGFQNDVPAVLDIVEGKHAISLVAPYGQTFVKDIWYYIVAIPGALDKGFALDFFKEDTHGGRVFDKSVTIKRSIYGTVTHADEGVSYTPCMDGIITFKDEKVKSILVSHFDVTGDGRISVREAAIVRSFLVKKAQTRADGDKVSIFAGTDITSFDELVWFTGLTRIEDGAFAGCEDLKSITIPETVTSIGDNAFNGCTGLQTILVMSPTPPAIGKDAFANSGDCPISVPEDAVDQYVSAWNEYAPRIKAAEEPVCPTPEKVDLGLPSGTLWASFNLGASKPEEYGNYYAWGETEPKSVFSWSTYKWYKKEGGKEGLTKYCPDPEYGFDGFKDDKWILDPEDDAAHVKLGEAWRMPTAGDWDELARLCTLEWVSLGGVDCAKLTGPNGNSIILPPGGGANDDSDLIGVGELGVFWSSSSVNIEGAWGFGFYKDMDEDDVDFPYPDRCLLVEPGGERSSGVSIRPVYGPASVLAESVTLDKTEINLKSGETVTLNASVLPEDATHKALLWISEDERIATVSSTGEVTGVGIGETVIHAVIMDGLKMAECTVMVGCPEAVDLGLPSGIRWASFNLGASYPYGDYYAWGETAPYYESGDAQSDSPRWRRYWNDYDGREIDCGQAGYGWESYRFSKYNYDYENDTYEVIPGSVTKYNTEDGITVLDEEDDAAHRLLGGEWRMPSWAEMNELRTQCTWEWTTQDGINGQKVTGPNGNSIFLPAAGDRYGLNLGYFGGDGLYWSSTCHRSYRYAIGLDFDKDGVYTVGSYYRYYGFPIRPVRGTVARPVESVSLDQTEIVLSVGETFKPTVTILPSDATFDDTSWSFSYYTYYEGTQYKEKPITLTRGEDGMITVTAVAPGVATITVVTMDGGKMAQCRVTVMDSSADSLVGDLVGTYTFTSSGSEVYPQNPWEVKITKDDENRGKVWFKNLIINTTYGDTMFYGIVDPKLDRIRIPFQQVPYPDDPDAAITLYRLSGDWSYTGAEPIVAEIVKDDNGRVIKLDFGENGIASLIVSKKWTQWYSYAFPNIIAEKQVSSPSSVRKVEVIVGGYNCPTEGKPDLILLTGDGNQYLVDDGIERRGSGRGVVDHQGKDNRVLAPSVRRRDVPAEAADPVHRSAFHVYPFFKGGVRFGHAGD